MEPTEHFEYDPDDPPPKETAAETYWYYMNRWSEVFMAYCRALGLI